jgi:antitoxin YefM
MDDKVTLQSARKNLARLMDRVVRNNEIIEITRPNNGNVAMIAAAELSSMLETIHVFESPNNAARVSAALDRALKKRGRPKSVSERRKKVGL